MTETDNSLNKVFSIFSPHYIPDAIFVFQILSDFFEFFGALESELPNVFKFQLMSDSGSNVKFELQVIEIINQKLRQHLIVHVDKQGTHMLPVGPLPETLLLFRRSQKL